MTNIYDCPTNFNSENKVTPLEVDNNYTQYNDTPFNNNANPGCKVTYRTPFNCWGCLILLGVICLGILFYGALTLALIQSKDFGVFYAFAFITVWISFFFTFAVCNEFYDSITIDPLHGKLTIRRIKVGCCCKSKEYELNNVKKIRVEGHNS